MAQARYPDRPLCGGKPLGRRGLRFAGTHSYTSPANCNGNVHTKACNAHAYNGPGNNRYGRRPTHGCSNCHAHARS